jgi:hypothetical protein
VVDLNLKYFNFTFNCEISHFDIKTVEMDPLHGLVDCFSQFRLTDLLDADCVGDSAVLVELSEQDVEVYFSSRVLYEHIPVSATASVSGLEIAYDL